MLRRLIPAVLLLLAACASSTPPPTQRAFTDILGVTLGMPRDTVRAVLATAGTFEREERKRQEVWSVRDPRFSSLLIGYDPDWQVRYVTAIASPAGAPLGYADVLDVATAERRSAGDTHTYTWKTGTPPYYVIAIGGPEHLTYLSLKKDPTAQQP